MWVTTRVSQATTRSSSSRRPPRSFLAPLASSALMLCKRRTAFSRRTGSLWPSAEAAMRGMATEYAAGNSRRPAWCEFSGSLGQLQAGPSGREWNGSQPCVNGAEMGVLKKSA